MWAAAGPAGPPARRGAGALRGAPARPETVLFAAAVGVLLGYELLLGLAVPPRRGTRSPTTCPGGCLGAARRLLLGAERADRPHQRVPAARRAGAALPVRRHRRRGALRTSPVPRAARNPGRGLRAARRLGFGIRAAASAALLLATLSLVALEATTAQNDLVAASFPVVAACLLLGEAPLEAGLAGVAVAFGIGAKLTTGSPLPVLLALALSAAAACSAGGRRRRAGVRRGRDVGLRPERGAHRAPARARRRGIEKTASPSYPGSG